MIPIWFPAIEMRNVILIEKNYIISAQEKQGYVYHIWQDNGIKGYHCESRMSLDKITSTVPLRKQNLLVGLQSL